MEVLKPIEHDGKTIRIDGKDLRKTLEDIETPAYVYSSKTIEDNFNRMKEHLCRTIEDKLGVETEIAYACKANGNPGILKIIKKLGGSIDCASIYEVERGMGCGYTPEKITYTSVSNTINDFKKLSEFGVERINIDCESDLKKMDGVPSGIRVNPKIGFGFSEKVRIGGKTQFGVSPEKAVEIARKLKEKGADSIGLHMQGGSGSVDAEDFREPYKVFLKTAKKIKDMGMKITYLDFGGGFGVPYMPKEKELDLNRVADILCECAESEGAISGETKIVFEPGRYIVADAGVLVSTATTIKDIDGSRFVGIDSGFHQLPRVALYGAYHHIVPENIERNYIPQTIYGRICECTDVFAKDRSIPEIKEGELVIIQTAGAYGYSMSSNFILYPRPVEVIV